MAIATDFMHYMPDHGDVCLPRWMYAVVGRDGRHVYTIFPSSSEAVDALRGDPDWVVVELHFERQPGSDNFRIAAKEV